jgi:hypothetical protein
MAYSNFAPTAVIRLTIDGNPKRPDTGAYVLFSLYKDGMLVEDYVNAVRAQPVRSNAAYVALKWDVEQATSRWLNKKKLRTGD